MRNGTSHGSAVSKTNSYIVIVLLRVFCFIIEVVDGRSDQIQGQPGRLFRSPRQQTEDRQGHVLALCGYLSQNSRKFQTVLHGRIPK
jgi:hypothetical protein